MLICLSLSFSCVSRSEGGESICRGRYRRGWGGGGDGKSREIAIHYNSMNLFAFEKNLMKICIIFQHLGNNPNIYLNLADVMNNFFVSFFFKFFFSKQIFPLKAI